MPTELHIHLHPETEDPDDILAGFPFEEGQTVIAKSRELIIIDLAGADDSTGVQDWYLNALDEVFSFYVVDDELPDDPGS
jgi:hypothetical protein